MGAHLASIFHSAAALLRLFGQVFPLRVLAVHSDRHAGTACSAGCGCRSNAKWPIDASGRWRDWAGPGRLCAMVGSILSPPAISPPTLHCSAGPAPPRHRPQRVVDVDRADPSGQHRRTRLVLHGLDTGAQPVRAPPKGSRDGPGTVNCEGTCSCVTSAHSGSPDSRCRTTGRAVRAVGEAVGIMEVRGDR